MSPPSPLPPAPDDDDAVWLAALAGQADHDAAAGQQSAAAREARLLREALLRWPEPVPDWAPSAAGLEALQAAVASQTPHAAAPARAGCRLCARIRDALARLALPPAAWAGLAVAGVVGIALVPGLLPPPADPPPVLRQGAAAQRLPMAEPRAARDLAAERLRRLGADVQAYERPGVHGLDAEFPGGADAAQRAEIAAAGWALGTDGSVRLEFVPAP